MSMRLAILCALLAACGSSSTGADIRITAPSGITHVELFVAPELCKPSDLIETCDTALGWDFSSDKLAGEIYILDIDRLTEANQLDDTHFRIQLKAGDVPQTVSRMLFLGTGSNVQAATLLKNVEIDTTSGEEWQLELTPIESIPTVPDRPTGDVDRLHVWNRNDGALARCVAIERWRGGEVKRDFLVPANDQDCDDVPDLFECDPYWWHSPPLTVGADDLSCTVISTVSALRGTSCLLGGMPCSERLGQAGCAAAKPYYCTGSPMCEPTCQADPAGCVEALQTATYKCIMPADIDGHPCVNSGGNAPLDVFPMNFSDLVVGSPSNCTGEIQFSDVSLSPTFVSPGVLGPITLTRVVDTTTGCHINVRWSGTIPSSDPAATFYGLVAVPLSNGTVGAPALMIDFRLNSCGSITPSCGAYWDIGDDVQDCAYF